MMSMLFVAKNGSMTFKLSDMQAMHSDADENSEGEHSKANVLKLKRISNETQRVVEQIGYQLSLWKIPPHENLGPNNSMEKMHYRIKETHKKLQNVKKNTK